MTLLLGSRHRYVAEQLDRMRADETPVRRAPVVYGGHVSERDEEENSPVTIPSRTPPTVQSRTPPTVPRDRLPSLTR